MKIVKSIAIVATLLAGVTAANASALNSMSGSFSGLQEADSASVLTVTANEALLLAYDDDVASIRARIEGNPWLVRNIEAQGFTVDQIVGFTGGENDLTLYAL